MWTAILTILLVGGGIWAGTLQSRRRLEGWQDAAQSCGLEVLETASAFNPHLKAWEGEGAMEVRIETFGDKGQSTRIVVAAPGPPDFQSVTIRPESMFKFGREIEIGDGYFDSTFFIEGPARLVLALLDPETRRLLVDLSAKGRLEIASGEIRAVLSRDEKVPDVLPLLLDVRRRFAPALEVGRRLAENAGQDPEPGVRLQNLLVLIRELPGDPQTAGALRKACSDPVPGIRLRAAREMGAEGRGVLLELAEGLLDDAVSAEAVSILEQELPFERTKAILDHALSRRCLQTAYACLQVLGRSGAAAVDALAKVLESEYGDLAPTAAWALGATGSPAAEPPLLRALLRGQTDLQVAAAHALGRVGSVAAVLPLKEANERVWLDPRLRRALRQAIAGIQARLQGASPGQLSLAGAEAGQLSLASDPAGRLSLGGDDAPDAAGIDPGRG